jgi:hypothetical protein
MRWMHGLLVSRVNTLGKAGVEDEQSYRLNSWSSAGGSGDPRLEQQRGQMRLKYGRSNDEGGRVLYFRVTLTSHSTSVARRPREVASQKA